MQWLLLQYSMQEHIEINLVVVCVDVDNSIEGIFDTYRTMALYLIGGRTRFLDGRRLQLKAGPIDGIPLLVGPSWGG